MISFIMKYWRYLAGALALILVLVGVRSCGPDLLDAYQQKDKYYQEQIDSLKKNHEAHLSEQAQLIQQLQANIQEAEARHQRELADLRKRKQRNYDDLLLKDQSELTKGLSEAYGFEIVP